MPDAERRLIAHERLPRAHHHLHDRADRTIVAGPRHPDPVLGDVAGVELPVPCLAAEREQVRLREVVAGQVVGVAEVGHADDRRVLVALRGPVDDLSDAAGRVGLRLERLLPHRPQVGQHRALARVLLRDLQLEGLVGVLHPAEHRVDGLARLEVQRAVLGLQEHVVEEAVLVVDRPELEVRALEPVGVDLGVVDERAPVDLHAQRRDRRGDAVGAVPVVVAEVLGPRLALGVGLHGEAHEVRDRRLQLACLARPPAAERVAVGVQLLVRERVGREPRVGGRRVVDGERDPDPVGAQRVGQRRLLRDVGRRQVDVVGVDEVDLEAVDADRRERARHDDVAVEDHRQVAPGGRPGRREVEDRPVLAVQTAGARRVVAGVQAHGLPVVEVAVRDPGRRRDVQTGDASLGLHASQEGEAPVQGGDLGLAGDDGEAATPSG